MVVARRPPKMNACRGTPLGSSQAGSMVGHCEAGAVKRALGCAAFALVCLAISGDRKSTRLNSSHLGISYAVFCLKKKRNDLPHQFAHLTFKALHRDTAHALRDSTT